MAARGSVRAVSPTLILICVVVAAYFATHVAFEWLARRYMVVSGAEYLLLGVLLGPYVSGLLGPGVLSGMAPFFTFALGWIGLLVGAQFYLPDLVRISRDSYRIAFTEALLSVALVAFPLTFFLAWWMAIPPVAAALPATALGAVAVATAPSGITLAARVLPRSHAMARQLQVTSAIDSLVGVVVLGILLSLYHPPVPTLARSPTPTEWAAIGIAIGVVGGALFHLFLGDERKTDRLFIGLAGAVTLASGAAAYARLSPLLSTMLIGMILTNTSRARTELRQVTTQLERPVYFTLLIFAGASWELSAERWVVPVVVFLVLRVLAKVAAAWTAAAASGALATLGPGWGRALLGQGGLAVALALTYQIQGTLALSHVVFTAAIASVLLTDLLSARLAASVVRGRDGETEGATSPTAAAAAREEV